MRLFLVVLNILGLLVCIHGQITTSPSPQPSHLELKHVSKCCSIEHLRDAQLLVDCVNKSTIAHEAALAATWTLLPEASKKIAIITYGTLNTFNYSAYAFAVNEAYSEHNGYLFHLADPNKSNYEPFDARWNKVKLLESAMDTWASDADFVVWLDADLIIMDMGLKLEKVIDEFPEAHLWFSIEHAGSHNLVNSGFVIVRKSKFTRWLLDEWWNTGDRQFLADQDSFDQFYAKFKTEKQLDKKVAMLPSDALNSEPPAAAHQQGHNQVQHLMGEQTSYRRRAFGSAFREVCRFHIQEQLADNESSSVDTDDVAAGGEDNEVEEEEEGKNDDEYDEEDDDTDTVDEDEDEEVQEDASEGKKTRRGGATAAATTADTDTSTEEEEDFPVVPLLPQLGADQSHLLAWALIEYRKSFLVELSRFTESSELSEIDHDSVHIEANQVQKMNNCASRYAEVLEFVEKHWSAGDIASLKKGKRNVLDKLLEGLPGAAIDPLLRSRESSKLSVVGAHPDAGSEVRLKNFYMQLRNVEISERSSMEKTIMSGERQVLLYELIDNGRNALRLMRSVKDRKKLVGTLLKYGDELYEMVAQARKIPVLMIQSELYVARGMIFFDQDEKERGLEDYMKGLKIKESFVEEVGDHSLPMMQIVVADALCRMGRFQDSWPYFHQAVEIAQRRLGPQHPQVVGYCYMAGQGHLAGGDHKSAVRLLQQAIAGMEANGDGAGVEAPGYTDLVRARNLLQMALEKGKAATAAGGRGGGGRGGGRGGDDDDDSDEEEEVSKKPPSKKSQKKKGSKKNTSGNGNTEKEKKEEEDKKRKDKKKNKKIGVKDFITDEF